MFRKHYFDVDERVQINRTTSSQIDGTYGTILGKAIRDLGPHPEYYIILLDEPLPAGDRAIVMTEACIDRVKERRPSRDWEVVYRVNETGATAELIIYDQKSKQDALAKAHDALGHANKDWYTIVRMEPKLPES